MAYTVDYAGEHAYIDGVETVTFTPQNPAGTPVTTVKALRSELTRRQIAMLGAVGLEPGDTSFVLWNATIGENVPKNGDKVTDSSLDEWYLTSVSKRSDGVQWICTARKKVA